MINMIASTPHVSLSRTIWHDLPRVRATVRQQGDGNKVPGTFQADSTTTQRSQSLPVRHRLIAHETTRLWLENTNHYKRSKAIWRSALALLRVKTFSINFVVVLA